MPQVRLLPLVALVAFCLLGLKGAALLFGGGEGLTGADRARAADPVAASGADAMARQNLARARAAAEDEAMNADAFPEPAKDARAPAGVAVQPDTSAPSGEPAQASAEAAPMDPAADDDLVTGATGEAPGPSTEVTQSESDVLNALSRRRKELDARERELGLRENLLKAAEQKVEARIAELKAIEGRITGQFKEEEGERQAEMKRLVQMYAQMKPKDAATIFNRLDIGVLSRMTRLMKPGEMSAILAAMDPAAAERLTLAIALDSVKPRQPAPEVSDLPKIEGVAAQ
jgi:flagellar motility protein MotE (MotC chaperone)